MKKIGLLISTFLLLYSTFLYAQDKPLVPVSGNKIIQITENAEGTLLAISDEGSVTVYDTSDYSPVCMLNDAKISKTAFYTEGSYEYFVSMTDSGLFQVWKLEKDIDTWVDELGEPYFFAECAAPERRKAITAVSFSQNADYIAAAFKDNTIQIHFRLRVTQSSISRQIKGHRAQIYGLEFNPTGEYLASVSTDGNAFIWNTFNNTKITQFSGVYARSRVPVYFTQDSNYIVFQDGRNTLRIADFSGNTLYSIMTGRPITALKPLKDPDLIAICNDKNEIMVYSISSRRQISIVKTPELKSDITQKQLDFTAFDFDSKADKMYAGFSDGAVYVYELQTYLDDTEMLITDAAFAGKGEGNFLHQRFSSLSVCGGANYLQEPYLLGADFRLEYLYSGVISPFFAGLGSTLSVGFPREEFPVQYKIRGELVDSPKLLSATFYVPVGYAFSPWNNDVRILTSFKAGARLTSLALITRQGSLIGEPDYSYFLSLGVGMQIKWFMFDLNCEYDGIGKVNPSAYAGYVFRWGER